MAGVGTESVQCESFGNRNLWLFISGTGVLRPKELIKRELTRNKEKLLNGLLFYKRPLNPQGDQLKAKKLSKQQRDFVQKLNVFLGLDELQSYDLFCSYISQDFRGSQKNLQLALSTERHMHGFMLKIRDFYNSERLYLLQCVKHILTYWPDPEHHPYREEYSEFLKVLIDDNELIKKFLEQLDSVCDASLPTWETNGKLMNERQALVWAHQNLQEQHELLEILLVYWKDFEATKDDFIKLLEKFKRQGFGRRQLYKHVLDDSMDRLLKRIGSLEVLVMLQALDMETVERLSHLGEALNFKMVLAALLLGTQHKAAEQTRAVDKSFNDHSLIRDKENFQAVDKIVQLFGNEEPHGPILLAWAVVRQLYLEDDRSHITRKMGNQALQLEVFPFLEEMLSREPFCGKSMTASLSHCVVYTLLLAALTAFDENTLTRSNKEMQVLYRVTSKLLEREFIAGNVWNKGLDQGVGHMFSTALLNFPLDFTTLVELSTALALATSDSASKILEFWSALPRYTEYLDKNSAQDIRPTQDRLVWQLARVKTPYTSGDFSIPVGVFGQLISNGRKSVSDMEVPIIQWEIMYDGWQLLKCEVQELLYQISRGAGMVSPVQISRVTDITKFIKAICTSQPEATDGLTDVISLLYSVVQRFTSFNPPPLDMLATSLECITCIAKQHPKQAWHDMKQTGLLPFLIENIDNMGEVLSGQGLSPGLYGALLAGFESTQGRYPLTLAFLDFVSQLVQPLYSEKMENELMPAVMYMLREIFPVFQKWRYYDTTRKEIIGQKCLAICQKILNFADIAERKRTAKLHLQDICIYSLLFTEAGRGLLEIIATGVETVELLLSQQSSKSEGSGEDLIQLIQSGFSVVNRLLLLRPSDQTVSPVEVALSSQPAGYQNQHIVGVIAEYIYHRTNPLLPKLATLFLKRLAVVLPMSILACLGNQAEPIRDVYLMRLQHVTEDLGLKTGILELLSVCVDTQPGLIEVFLNVQTVQPTDPAKGLTTGRASCLQTVLDLMDLKKQTSYQCPTDLLCACTDFIQSLWGGLRETAMAALRSKASFWPSLCQPVLKDLVAAGDAKPQMLTFALKTVSNIFKILAQEIFTMTSAKLDENLKKVLQEISNKDRLKFWSNYITNCVKTDDNEVRQTITAEATHNPRDILNHPTVKLLTAWKNFLIVLAKNDVAELQMTDGLKETIMLDLLEAIHTQFSNSMTELTHRLAQNCSALFFTLVKTWTSSFSNIDTVLRRVHEVLSLSLTSGDMIIPSVQIGLLGSITAIIQYPRIGNITGVDIPMLRSLLVTVCEVLLQNTRELPLPRELKDIHDGQDKSFVSTDYRLKLQIVTCCLAEELIQQIKDSSIWLPVLQEHIILTALLSSADVYLKAQGGIQYMQTLFLLLITIARSEKGAEALALAGLTEHTCLAITHCYQTAVHPGPTPNRGKTTPASPTVTWQGVYCLCLELYATQLEVLKYSFLEDALNFVGCHQDRLQQSLDVARLGAFHDSAFSEAEKTCSLVRHLSQFRREWRLHLPESLRILTSMMYMCQTFVSYLIRPRYLQHILEHQAGDRRPGKRGHETILAPTLQHQTSTEDIENPSTQLVNVQKSMLKTLAQSLCTLRQFSPNLVQILFDQNMDIGEFEPFLSMGFNAPPVDQDIPPTFGTLLTCVSVCLRLLMKIDPVAVSPQRGGAQVTPDNTLAQNVPKSLVFFVMENALYLTMSQGMLYLKDPQVSPREKPLLKRELGTEMNSFLSDIQRYFRRGTPQSPVAAPLPRSQSPGDHSLIRSVSQTFTSSQEQAIFKVVQQFSKQVLT